MAGSGTQVTRETQGKSGERQKVRLHGALAGPLQILGTGRRDVPRAARQGWPAPEGRGELTPPASEPPHEHLAMAEPESARDMRLPLCLGMTAASPHLLFQDTDSSYRETTTVQGRSWKSRPGRSFTTQGAGAGMGRRGGGGQHCRARPTVTCCPIRGTSELCGKCRGQSTAWSVPPTWQPAIYNGPASAPWAGSPSGWPPPVPARR